MIDPSRIRRAAPALPFRNPPGHKPAAGLAVITPADRAPCPSACRSTHRHERLAGRPLHFVNCAPRQRGSSHLAAPWRDLYTLAVRQLRSIYLLRGGGRHSGNGLLRGAAPFSCKPTCHITRNLNRQPVIAQGRARWRASRRAAASWRCRLAWRLWRLWHSILNTC